MANHEHSEDVDLARVARTYEALAADGADHWRADDRRAEVVDLRPVPDQPSPLGRDPQLRIMAEVVALGTQVDQMTEALAELSRRVDREHHGAEAARLAWEIDDLERRAAVRDQLAVLTRRLAEVCTVVKRQQSQLSRLRAELKAAVPPDET